MELPFPPFNQLERWFPVFLCWWNRTILRMQSDGLMRWMIYNTDKFRIAWLNERLSRLWNVAWFIRIIHFGICSVLMMHCWIVRSIFDSNQIKPSLGELKKTIRECIHSFVVINCFQVYDSVMKLFWFFDVFSSDMTRIEWRTPLRKQQWIVFAKDLWTEWSFLFRRTLWRMIDCIPCSNDWKTICITKIARSNWIWFASFLFWSRRFHLKT